LLLRLRRDTPLASREQPL